MRDHYEVLQVSREAEPEVVERAYKALSLKYHPDRVDADERDRANRKMQRINEAYRVLRDANARERYDVTLASEPGSSGWELFLDKGLVGLFADWYRTRPR